MDVRLDTNQLENGNYNLISVLTNKIQKSLLCVYTRHEFEFLPPVGIMLEEEGGGGSSIQVT